MPFDPMSYIAGKNAGGGGGTSVTVEELNVTENDTYTADAGKAFNPVNVTVPNSYTAGDEGKVVSNGALVAQTAHAEVTQNGTVDTTLNNSVTVNVGVNWDGFAAGTWPVGNAVLSNSVTDIPAYAFYDDAGITSISGPEVLTINEYGIYKCTGLTSVYFPKVTRIGESTNNSRISYVFSSCTNLRTINLPELLNANCGYNLALLGKAGAFVTIVVPKITFLGAHTFRGCLAEAIDIGPDLTTLSQYNFYSGTYNNIILRRTAGVVDAPASHCITSIGSSTKVWVPNALIDSYKAATNWSAKGDIFYAIEGSIYEHAYADGTPIPTT